MDSGSIVGSSLLNHALGAFIADAPRPGTKVADLFAPSGVLTWLCFVCLARPRTTSCSSCGVDLVPTCSAEVRPGISCHVILSFVHRPLLSFLRHSRHCAVCALAYTYISLIFAARRRRLCFAGCTISLLAFLHTWTGSPVALTISTLPQLDCLTGLAARAVLLHSP